MTSPRPALRGLGVCLLCSISAVSRADERSGSRKLPEPVLAETITDIDGAEAGEVEFDAVVSTARSRRHERSWQSALEVEWRATERLGLALQGGAAGTSREGNAGPGMRAGASWMVLRDFARDLYLQAELNVRIVDGARGLADVDVSDAALPISFGLRWGIRLAPLTLRAGLGGQVDPQRAHDRPFWQSIAILLAPGSDARIGFTGIEILADWAYEHPLAIAPDLQLDGARYGLPIRLGLAVPWKPRAASDEPSLGVYVRIIVEVE